VRFAWGLVLAAHLVAGPVGLAPSALSVAAIPAAQIVQSLRQHEPVDLDAVHVVGALDLRSIDTVTTAILCRHCTLDGLSVANVTFARTVDFTGTTIAGLVDGSGATFNGPVLFNDATFGGDLDLSDANLTDLVDFSGTTFDGGLRFDAAHFRGVAQFDNVDVRGPASYVGASFGARASFSGINQPGVAARQPVTRAGCGPAIATGGGFEQRADFRQATFAGEADFRQVCVVGPVMFGQASFAGPLLAGQSHLSNDANFDNVRFDGGASFIGAGFGGSSSFSRATAGGRVDFEAAEFAAVPIFSYFDSTAVMSFTDARLPSRVIFDHVTAKELDLGFGDIHRLGAAQTNALKLVEDGARARGNIALANRARYDRLAIEGSHRVGVHGLVDWLGYRVIAGYMVRPLRPLSWLVAAVVLAALVRTVWGHRKTKRRSPGPPLSFAHEIQRGAGIAMSRKAYSEDEKPATESAWSLAGRWLEWGLYKALLLATLVGVANSNDTLRQMLDAIK
jgi:uncharacterized protein YjbI with pentapeptide repeats